MKVIKLSTLILAIFLTLPNSKAYALIDVPTFRFGVGESPLTFNGGTAFPSQPLGAKLYLNPMFLWDIPGIRSRIGADFSADIGSPYGAIATAGIGITALFYPLGLSSSREVRDDFSELIKTRISPYFQLEVNPTKFAASNIKVVSGNTPSASNYFSARLLEISLGLGVDYPFTRDLVGFIGLHYRTALLQTQTSSQINGPTSNYEISYSGIALLLGISTNFY